MKTILVVDDEPKIVELARDYLELAGFAVVSASDGSEALARAHGDAELLRVEGAGHNDCPRWAQFFGELEPFLRLTGTDLRAS